LEQLLQYGPRLRMNIELCFHECFNKYYRYWTTHVNLLSRLRMSRAVVSIPSCVLKASCLMKLRSNFHYNFILNDESETIYICNSNFYFKVSIEVPGPAHGSAMLSQNNLYREAVTLSGVERFESRQGHRISRGVRATLRSLHVNSETVFWIRPRPLPLISCPTSDCRLQPPAQAGSSLADISTLTMEAIRCSETSDHTRSTRRHIPEDGILRSHRRENLKSYNS
jgi:hypothetical protein